jgi:hypothetical protein
MLAPAFKLIIAALVIALAVAAPHSVEFVHQRRRD